MTAFCMLLDWVEFLSVTPHHGLLRKSQTLPFLVKKFVVCNGVPTVLVKSIAVCLFVRIVFLCNGLMDTLFCDLLAGGQSSVL